MPFCVLACIAKFGECMPYAFAVASPDSRIAAERYCVKGYELKDIEEGNRCCTFICLPDRTKKNERHLTKGIMRLVVLECIDYERLHVLWTTLSWWCHRQQSVLRLGLELEIREEAAVNVDVFSFSEHLGSLFVSLDASSTVFVKEAEKMSGLEALSLNGNDGTVDLGKLTAHCPQLRHLRMDRCEIESIAGLAMASQLHSLELDHCNGSIDLSLLRETLPNLVELRILFCKDLSNVFSLRDLTNLQTLELKCVNDFSLDMVVPMDLKEFAWSDEYPYSNLHILTLKPLCALSLTMCTGLVSLDGLEKARRLEELCLKNGTVEMIDLPPCPSLRAFELRFFDQLRSVSGFDNAPNLTSISLWSIAIETLNLPPLPRLTKLEVSNCVKLTTLTGLQGTPMLTSLTLRNAAVETLDLPPSPHLTEISLQDCEKVTTVKGIQNAPILTSLNLRATAIETLFLPLLLHLTEVDLTDCEKLVSLSGIQNTPNLSTLLLSTTAIETLELPSLPHLTEISLTYCEKLSAIRGFSNIPKLLRLYLPGTQAINTRELEHCTCLNQVFLPKSFKNSGDSVVDLLNKRNVRVAYYPISGA